MVNLKKIKNIYFTPREIDVIACLLSGKTAKSAGNLLSVSPKTIEAHTYKIMAKIDCHSKEELLQFIEQSNEFEEVRTHYYSLLSKSENKITYQPISENSFRKLFISLFKKKNLYHLLLAFLGIIFLSTSVGLYKLVSSNQKKVICSDFYLPIKSELLSRLKTLGDIKKSFYEQEDIQKVVLFGLSGSGKTFLARQYMKGLNFPVIWEINAETPESLINSFSNLAYALSTTKNEKAELENIVNNMKEKENYKNLLYFIKEKLIRYENWFLLFDNADNFEIVQPFLPCDSKAWGNGQVLVTTKNENFIKHKYFNKNSIVYIPELDFNEKISLFKKIIKNKKLLQNDAEIVNLIKHIPSYPLEVSVFAYYIRNNPDKKKIYTNLFSNIDRYKILRKDLIDKIEKSLACQKDLPKVIIYGGYGSGKATLANQFMDKFSSGFTFELDAKTKESYNQSQNLLAKALASDSQDQQLLERIIKLADPRTYNKELQKFIQTKLKHKWQWVLFFNNVTQLEDINLFVSADKKNWGNGRILIATCNEKILDTDKCSVVNIGKLTSDEKLSLFSNLMNENTESSSVQKMTELLNNIPSYPRDIIFASFYLKNTGISYADYAKQINVFQSYQFEIEKNKPDQNVRYAIVINTLEKITKHTSDYNLLLFILSILDSKCIPSDLLIQCKNKKIVESFIHNMCRYGLAQCLTDSEIKNNTALFLHEDIQKIVQKYLKKKFETDTLKDFLNLSLENIEIYLNKIINLMDVTQLRKMLIHLEKIHSHKDVLLHQYEGFILHLMGRINYYLGDYQTAKSQLNTSISLLESNSSNKYSLRLIYAKELLGTVLDELSEHTAAQLLLENSAEYYRTTKTHTENLAWCLLNLGKVYSQLGLYEKAERVLQESINIYSELEGKNLHNIAQGHTFLAEVYLNSCKYDLSKIQYVKSINIYKKINKKHPKIIWNEFRLGKLYVLTGNYQKAISLIKKADHYIKNNLLEDKDKIGWSATHLGNTYRLLGCYEEAYDNLNRGYQVYVQYFGINHILTAWIAIYLGQLYLDQGKTKQALDLLEKSYETHVKLYGKNHKRVMIVSQALAKTYIKTKNLDLAENLLNNCLTIHEQNFGKNHAEYAFILCDLGCVHKYKKNYKVSEKLFNEAFRILKQHKHIEIYKCLEYLSDLPNQSTKYIQQALEIVKINFPKKSAHIKRILSKLPHTLNKI